MYFFQYKCKHFTKYATIHWKCQSSCYKSTKRCVQTVKLNSLKEICVFIWVFERTSFADSFSVLILFWLCTFIASPTAVTQPHHFLFYILAIQHVIKIIFRSLESLVQIVSYFLYILSLSLSPSLLEFICLTFNNIRIYVTTFGKHIKYERYLTHLWPERHVAHFMLFFPYRKQLCDSVQNVKNYLFALKDHP